MRSEVKVSGGGESCENTCPSHASPSRASPAYASPACVSPANRQQLVVLPLGWGWAVNGWQCRQSAEGKPSSRTSVEATGRSDRPACSLSPVPNRSFFYAQGNSPGTMHFVPPLGYVTSAQHRDMSKQQGMSWLVVMCSHFFFRWRNWGPLYSLSYIRRNYGQYGGISLSKYAGCMNLSRSNRRHVPYDYFIHSFIHPFSHAILQVWVSWAHRARAWQHRPAACTHSHLFRDRPEAGKQSVLSSLQETLSFLWAT